MATTPAHEPAEARLITRPASHQHQLHLKSNRFHPWLAAKCTSAKPNIAPAASPSSSSDAAPKSPDERNTAERIISHSINSIINGR
jgi:hypothetical protein